MNIERPDPHYKIPKHATCAFEGEIFNVYQWEQEMFDGSTATFEQLTRDDTVIIIPVTKQGTFVVLEQQQPGRDWFKSLPGGRIDPGEDPLTAAKRELREESGYVAEDMDLWFAIQPTGKIDWTSFVFVARGLQKVGEPTPDSGERFKVQEVSFETFLEFVTDESFRGTEIVTTILRAQLNPKKMAEMKALFGVVQ